MDTQDLKNRFTYHKPEASQPEIYERLRSTAHVLAQIFDGCCPDSREKSLAITKLEESVMWANASIARHGLPNIQPIQYADADPDPDLARIKRDTEETLLNTSGWPGPTPDREKIHYKLYIGTKIIRAKPMTEKNFLANIKKQTVALHESDREGYVVIYKDDYKSWSPKKAFEDAYREILPDEMAMIFRFA